jgi:hypothetical protein
MFPSSRSCLRFRSYRPSSARVWSDTISLPRIHQIKRMCSGNPHAVEVNATEPAPKTLEIDESNDDAEVRRLYRPFLLDSGTSATDWIAQLELFTVMDMVRSSLHESKSRIKVLVLFGSLRKRSEMLLSVTLDTISKVTRLLRIIITPFTDRTLDFLLLRQVGYSFDWAATFESMTLLVFPSKTTFNMTTTRSRNFAN